MTEVHAKSCGTYGVPRIHAVLKREGALCGLRRVARLMRAAGLEGRYRRRRHLTTIPDPRAATRPDLILRQFDPDPAGIDTRWCGDITYVPTEEGWLYLATVIDIASRRVIGWATADHLRTDLVADALIAACRQRRPTRPAIFHSDRGCQYTSQQFAFLATEFGARLTVGRTGQCWDNALAESFFATIKREVLDTSSWPSRAAARTAIFDLRAGTTCTDCTAASATAVPPNTRPHSRPGHHTDGVRQSGTSSPQARLHRELATLLRHDNQHPLLSRTPRYEGNLTP
ncbi:IS3 family transposase [Streptomyces caniscabiei]|uniref:IS3 family transposase n=1 Tax=Streptomyces caniscabiei TaxID=2746961 RepID=UPI001F24AE21|nr:IS3 family transposase [Streptomyces caniscabiei]